MRSINELYRVFLDKYPVSGFRVGLCINLIALQVENIMSKEECEILDAHLQSQRPTKNDGSGFYLSSQGFSCYWWPTYSNCKIERFTTPLTPIEVRKEFIKHLIEITK